MFFAALGAFAYSFLIIFRYFIQGLRELTLPIDRDVRL
jgi:hypothetical protein